MHAMSRKFTPEQRRILAAQIGVNPAYLYQCLAGLRDMNPGAARRAETITGGQLRRRDLCQKTWAQIWPELAEQAAA